eukprot:scaffold748_cov251-Pinguiococcus_pyrenoidosus.AAC.2
MTRVCENARKRKSAESCISAPAKAAPVLAKQPLVAKSMKDWDDMLEDLLHFEDPSGPQRKRLPKLAKLGEAPPTTSTISPVESCGPLPSLLPNFGSLLLPSMLSSTAQTTLNPFSVQTEIGAAHMSDLQSGKRLWQCQASVPVQGDPIFHELTSILSSIDSDQSSSPEPLSAVETQDCGWELFPLDDPCGLGMPIV